MSREAVLIDSALDFDASKNSISTGTANALLSFMHENDYAITQTLETHALADHLTAAQYVKPCLPTGPPVGIGEKIIEVQRRFGPTYRFPEETLVGIFVRLCKDNDAFTVDNTQWTVLHLATGSYPSSCRVSQAAAPRGRTKAPDSVTCAGRTLSSSATPFSLWATASLPVLFYVLSVLMWMQPDVGSARADFLGGSVEELYHSAQRLLSLPDDTRILSGHDYPGTDRSHYCSTTVAEQRAVNKHLKDGINVEDFTKMRKQRDSTLAEP